MPNILIVEDSATVAKLVAGSIEQKIPNAQVVTVNSLSKASTAIVSKSDWLVAIVGLHLKDAPRGVIVDLVQSHNVPVIVLTADMDESVREEILKKNVFDYVIKGNRSELQYVANMVERLEGNSRTSILVVDDCSAQRLFISRLLEVHQYKVHHADSGVAALSILSQHPEISMVITDYEMPEMNGVELVRKIREQFHRDDMSIIGISSGGNGNLFAKLLKAGANDCLKTPFIVEEFYCRLSQNIDMREQLSHIKESAKRDYMTQLYNRRYLFEAGEVLYKKAKEKQLHLCAAMIDIDHFKLFNDTYGHVAGDKAIRLVADVIQSSLPGASLSARYGGEEFCVLLFDSNEAESLAIFENLRQEIESQSQKLKDIDVPITISVGVSEVLGNSLEELIHNADELLYSAKKSGRNQVTLAA
ncbi:MAG: diguanylate cyclase [Gammaproteobacteria bacterium]|nr:diguanylate cyclase [Gammaproteobacteria bacterium]